ncbi:MAG: lipocalin family protein [Bacteroidota bacterium]
MNFNKKLFSKHSFSAIAFVLMLAIFSCGDDDGTVNENPLVGIWQLSSVALDGETGELHPCSREDTIEFRADNSYEQISYINDPSISFEILDCVQNNHSTTQGTWQTPSSVKLNLTYDDGESLVTRKTDYVISGNTLTLTFVISLGNITTTYTRI